MLWEKKRDKRITFKRVCYKTTWSSHLITQRHWNVKCEIQSYFTMKDMSIRLFSHWNSQKRTICQHPSSMPRRCQLCFLQRNVRIYICINKRNLERNMMDRPQNGLSMFQISGFVFHVYLRTCKSAVRLKQETNYQRIRGDGRKKKNETGYESEKNGNKYLLMT